MSNQDEGNNLQSELLTVKEVAAYLRVSRVTAWRWCQQGIIPAFRIGRNWRIYREELLKLGVTSGSDHRGPNLVSDGSEPLERSPTGEGSQSPSRPPVNGGQESDP